MKVKFVPVLFRDLCIVKKLCIGRNIVTCLLEDHCFISGLGDILVTPGFCDEVIHLFLARELIQVAAQPELHEVIEVHWIPLDQALAQVYDGTLRDAKTMLGLTLAEKIIRH